MLKERSEPFWSVDAESSEFGRAFKGEQIGERSETHGGTSSIIRGAKRKPVPENGGTR